MAEETLSAEDAELMADFLAIARERRLWKHVQAAYSDGQIDIPTSEWERIEEVAAALRLIPIPGGRDIP